MSTKNIASTVRHSRDVARQIDAKATRQGFASRSKFMLHAALNFEGELDDSLASELSRISFALHQINRAEEGRVHLLKRQDVAELSRLARSALSAIISRNAG